MLFYSETLIKGGQDDKTYGPEGWQNAMVIVWKDVTQKSYFLLKTLKARLYV